MGRKTIHNRIVTEETKAKINPQNLQLIEDFVVYFQSLGRSQGTIDGYVSDLYMAFSYNLE